MVAKIEWTEEMDAIVIAGRLAKKSWDDIGAQLNMSGATVFYRGQKLGLPIKLETQIEQDKLVLNLQDMRRDVLPPGNPVTWGAITANTVLDGVQYPYP